eukprot:TRINITY_DN21774_c0_g1_i1.p2 TRINITY_DN21774_c0_g1~~TRINITY_DN21774_c0_g1_i1.p2  ORF type:complete len:204 (+),score=79.69 TRINITY_DN21774_c0_g1_i1:49-660(+)
MSGGSSSSSSGSASQQFTLAQVKAKCTDGQIWMVIQDVVYDLTQFRHPGGTPILKQWQGRDATKPFMAYHRWVSLDMAKPFVRGRLKHEAIVLSDTAPRRQSDPDVRGALETLGVGDIAGKLSDLQIAELSKAEAPANESDEGEAAILEIFESLADPHTETVTHKALASFLEQLGADTLALNNIPKRPLTRDQFVAFVEGLDM